jgi:antirestriction protein ArdC
MKQNEIYQTVTDTIIELLEQHKQDWDRPWITFGQSGDMAHNATTNINYRGINQFLLSFVLVAKGYLQNSWLTFHQVDTLGGRVLKGEKASPIAFFNYRYINQNKKYIKPETVKKMSAAEYQSRGIKKIPILKHHWVFNVAQTDGLDQKFYDIPESKEPLEPMEKDDRAEELIASTGAMIEVIKGNRAYYDRSADKIRLPLREQFRGEAEPFYATALHELGHWTGAEHRLNRTFGSSFGDADYAKEELVAELTSAFCCATLGFSKTINSNAAYIDNWLGVLKQDKRAVMRAATQAQKAADYIFDAAGWDLDQG